MLKYLSHCKIMHYSFVIHRLDQSSSVYFEPKTIQRTNKRRRVRVLSLKQPFGPLNVRIIVVFEKNVATAG